MQSRFIKTGIGRLTWKLGNKKKILIKYKKSFKKRFGEKEKKESLSSSELLLFINVVLNNTKWIINKSVY